MNAHAQITGFQAKAALIGELAGFAVGDSMGFGLSSSSMVNSEYIVPIARVALELMVESAARSRTVYRVLTILVLF